MQEPARTARHPYRPGQPTSSRPQQCRMQHAAIVAAVQPAPASHPAGPQYASTESDLDGSARPSLGSPFTLRLARAPRSFPSAGAECTGVTGRMVRSPIRRFLNRSSGVGRWRCYGGPLFLGESAVGPGSGRAFGLPEPGPGWGSGGFGRFARSRYHLRPQTACGPPSRGTSAGSTTSAGCTRCRSGAVVAVPDPAYHPSVTRPRNPLLARPCVALSRRCASTPSSKFAFPWSSTPRAHSRFPGHALTPTGVMAIRCKQFHLPDL